MMFSLTPAPQWDCSMRGALLPCCSGTELATAISQPPRCTWCSHLEWPLGWATEGGSSVLSSTCICECQGAQLWRAEAPPGSGPATRARGLGSGAYHSLAENCSGPEAPPVAISLRLIGLRATKHTYRPYLISYFMPQNILIPGVWISKAPLGFQKANWNWKEAPGLSRRSLGM